MLLRVVSWIVLPGTRNHYRLLRELFYGWIRDVLEMKKGEWEMTND